MTQQPSPRNIIGLKSLGRARESFVSVAGPAYKEIRYKRFPNQGSIRYK